MKSQFLFPRKFAAIFLGWAACLLSPAALAQTACPPPPAPLTPEKAKQLSAEARDHGVLWKFERNGRTGYLYGTIHVNRLEWLFPGPKTAAAFRDTDTLALELDVLSPEVQAKVSQPESLGIKTLVLPPPLQQRMNAVAEKVCAPVSLIAGRHAVMQLITVTIFDARLAGLEASYGSDFFLASIAKSVAKPVVGLETAELQMRTLLGGSDKESMELVDSSLTLFESGKQRKQTQRLTEDWANGNLADLQSFEQWCDCTTTEPERRFMRRINDDRNAGLAAGIDKLHKEGKRVFVAIGTLHMVGPKGVTQLLAGMGYKVERVAFEAKP
ncbi:MAG: TraB/GumN family protein [Betaproteobacteria bacterium]|nr:TraB/GumN family protein [Betaproteobacteria bacterium]